MNIEQVWSEYRGQINAFLHTKVSDTVEIEDLLQEILIKTHKNLHTIKDEDKIKAWLFQVANNTIIDFYRMRAKGKNLNGNDLWYNDDEPDTQKKLSQCVKPFIEALPDDSAKLLTAIDIEGQSQKHYAQQIGVSYSTLKSRVQKARAELKHMFEQCCDFALDSSGNLAEFEPKSGSCKTC